MTFPSASLTDAVSSHVRLAHVGASAELDTVADKVIQVVKVMDGLNRFHFAEDPQSLAAWERQQHHRSASARRRETRAAGPAASGWRDPAGGSMKAGRVCWKGKTKWPPRESVLGGLWPRSEYQAQVR